MTPAPYVPIEPKCPTCGQKDWGLQVGPLLARCPVGHPRPVRRLP